MQIAHEFEARNHLFVERNGFLKFFVCAEAAAHHVPSFEQQPLVAGM